MEKKYQVFISSTYEDLKEERFAVMQTLLDFDCIPVGMEQFPASDMSQMEYIQKLIDECDYYLLILAGKYGSTDTDGVGYTEREYDYAISKKIPVMRHVIKDINNLTVSQTESADEGREKLNLFRKKVCQSKLVKFYNGIDSLKYNVAQSLKHYIKEFPREGWIRSNNVAIDEKLEKTLDSYMQEYMKKHTATIEDIEELFATDEVILKCGDSSSFEKCNVQINGELPEGMISAVETFAEKMPEVMGTKKDTEII